MTRTQAENLAIRVKDMARAVANERGEAATWTSVTFKIPVDLRDAIDKAPHMVTGCLPMGWRLTGPMGELTLTVERAL